MDKARESARKKKGFGSGFLGGLGNRLKFKNTQEQREKKNRAKGAKRALNKRGY